MTRWFDRYWITVAIGAGWVPLLIALLFLALALFGDPPPEPIW
jgi:hypothetical protein